MNMPPSLDITLGRGPESVGAARRAVRSIARECGASEHDVSLAISEAISNAVVHGYRAGAEGTIRVSANCSAGRLLVCVEDDGKGMSGNSQSTGLGAGIGLMSRLADEVSFRSTADGTKVSMWFQIKASG